MNDYRLYYYQYGMLKKNNSRFHKFKSIEECDEYIEKKRTTISKYASKADTWTQYVLVKYTAPFESLIIKLYNPTI